MTFGKNNYTGFQAVNLKGSGGILFGINDANQGTISINSASLEASRNWNLPDKSGVFPISGTFAVQLPAALGNNVWFSTLATVSGIRAEDALTVSFQGEESTSYGYGGTSTKYILLAGKPLNGQIQLDFYNLGQGTGYTRQIYSYTAVR